MRLFELGLREFAMMDSIWVILLSVSTVGYGDIFPETDYGRVVLVVHQVMGVVVLSTLVAVVQSKLSLTNRRAMLLFIVLGWSLCTILMRYLRENLLVTSVARAKVAARQPNLLLLVVTPPPHSSRKKPKMRPLLLLFASISIESLPCCSRPGLQRTALPVRQVGLAGAVGRWPSTWPS